MADVTLGFLRDQWKGMLDWVKGIDATSKPKVSAITLGEVTSVSPVTGTKTITATAAEVFAGASVLANRSRLVVKNEDPVLRIRVGRSTVTQQTGFPVEPGATVVFKFDPGVAVSIFAISEGASVPVSVWEG